jgi:hypothetical protein
MMMVTNPQKASKPWKVTNDVGHSVWQSGVIQLMVLGSVKEDGWTPGFEASRGYHAELNVKIYRKIKKEELIQWGTEDKRRKKWAQNPSGPKSLTAQWTMVPQMALVPGNIYDNERP